MIADAVTVRVERSKVGGGGVQDVVLDLGVRGLGQVSLWKPEEAVKVDSSYVMWQLEVKTTLGSKQASHYEKTHSESERRESHRRTKKVLNFEMSFPQQESTV